MPAPIVVEVYAPQPRPQELSALLSACTRAAVPNECITSDAKSSEPPLGVAIVRREGNRARVELGLRGDTQAEWSTRDLTFQPGDDELERYRAIGFAIGTLVAKRTEPLATESAPPAESSNDNEPNAPPLQPPSPQPAPPAPEPLPRQSSPPSTRATWAELSGSAGLGLIPGPPRLGMALRAATEMRARGLFAVFETSYAERIGEPELRVRWVGMALGLGHPLPTGLRSLGIDARVSFLVQRISFTAVQGELSAQEARWKPGALVGIGAHWDVAPPLSLLLGVSSVIDPKSTAIVVGGADGGELPVVGLDGFFGLRLKLH